jgi:uncharacterized repeat protein (TIGR01451 family)
MLIGARDYVPGTQSNTAQVRSNETDLVETNDTATVSVRVLEHDVAITKTADNPTPPLGGLVTYTIRVTNFGPDTAEVLDVYDVVTEGSSTFVSGIATQGKVVPEALPPFYLPGAPAPARLWTIPLLPVGATETLTLVERVTSLGRLTNTAATDAGLHLDRSPSNDGDRFPDNNFASTTVEVQSTADVAITKRVSEATPRVGDPVTFTVTATNHGPNDATGVQVSDSLPVGLTWQSVTPSQGHYDPTTGAWTVGTLATGAAATLDLTARVDQAGALTNVATKTVADQFDPNPSNNAGGVTLTGLPSADIQVRKTVTNPAPDVDDDITFTLTVTNAGPTAASGVQVTDLLPAGLTLVRATPSQGTYTATTGVWDIGGLANGAHVTLDLVATVTQAGLFTTLATKTAQGEDDPVSTNNAAGVILNGQEADLQVVTSADQTTPTVGQPVTVTETVTNSGPSAASGVQVTTPLPGGLTFVDATPSQGTYNPSTGVWDLGTLASAGAGATAVLTLTARVDAAGTLHAATRAQSVQLDPNPTNDRGSLTVVGQVRADLTIAKHTEAQEVRPGTPLTYTIVVTNQGPSAVTGARVTDPLSHFLTDVTWTCTASPGSRCPAAGTGPIAVLVDLLPGGTVTFTLQALVAVTATGVLINQATVTGPEGTVDVMPDNNLAAEILVVTAPELQPPAGVKTVETTGLPTLTWRVVWLNPANTAPLRLRVFDPIPVVTTYIDGSVTCVARGQSTVEHCAFDAATNQLVTEGLVGADPGATTEAQATNAVVITFQTTVLPGVTQVANQALAHWDATSNGTVDDDISAGQVPAQTGTTLEEREPTVATLPALACLFQQRLLALMVPASTPSEGAGDGDASTADAAVDEGVDRLLALGAAADFGLTTPLDDTTVAGTALTLAAVPVAGTGATVSQPAAIRLVNGSPTETVDVVEHVGSKTERVPAGKAHVSVTADGVVVELPTTALVTTDTLHLDRVHATDAPAPQPGAAVSPLVAVALESGQTAFRAPIILSLPYRDIDHDGVVDATSPPLPALDLTVWRFDAARQRWVQLPEARVFTAFRVLRVATAQTGLYGVFQAADGNMGLAGTSAPAPTPPLSAGAQGSGWQDIGVVTTFPFLVPFNTTALPDGTYAVRVSCATQVAALAAVQDTPASTTPGGGASGGGGCSLRPGGGWSRATALDAVGHLGVPLVVLLVLWIWRRPRCARRR